MYADADCAGFLFSHFLFYSFGTFEPVLFTTHNYSKNITILISIANIFSRDEAHAAKKNCE